MLKPVSLKEAPRYPVTASVSAAAIVVSGLYWSKQNVDVFFMTGRVWDKWELWRALTCTLPHGDFFHLLFNLYWLWALGTLVERIWGHMRFASIILLFGFGSALAEFMFLEGGIGLSGVGYGLWGMLLVLDRYDRRFAGAMDRQTSHLFIYWFFICIILTLTKVMLIANIAHGVGALMGILMGLAVSRRGPVKWASAAGLVAVVVLTVAGSTVLWPKVNRFGFAAREIEQLGEDALFRHDDVRGKELLELATTMKGTSHYAWYNLGIAYVRLGKYDEALAAFDRAIALSDASPDFQKAARELREQQRLRKQLQELQLQNPPIEK
jgi:membrane associated rhomboid family serine protease